MQVDDLQLVALPSAINCAELFVRFALTEWSLRAMVDEATHAVTTLVGQVVEISDQRSPCMITVRLRVHSDCLVVEIEDDSLALPPAEPPALTVGRTGIVPGRMRGKLVWCELPLPSGMSASSVPLPRRGRRRAGNSGDQISVEQVAANSAANADVDPQVMERILYGLRRSPDAQIEYEPPMDYQ
jgi:hypothetical protein